MSNQQKTKVIEGLNILMSTRSCYGDREDDICAMWNTIKKGDIECIKKLFDEGYNPNICFEHSWSSIFAIHEAVESDNITIVKLLLDHGANVNCAATYWAAPAFHLTMDFCKSNDMKDLLLNKGCYNVDLTDFSRRDMKETFGVDISSCHAW